MAQRMVIDDKSSDSGARTSIKMTRSMGEDIGWVALDDIMEAIEKHTINLSYSKWEWFIGFYWNDDVWKNALSKVINKARKDNFNLNKCSHFLDFIFTHTPVELHAETKSGMHPVFRQAVMELVGKKRQKETPRELKIEDLFP